MNPHLNDDELAGVVLGSASLDAGAHLEGCEACREELRRIQAALAGFGAQARARADRPEAFWQWQRGAIARRIAEATVPRHPSARLFWAGTTALLALAAWLMLPAEAPPATPLANRDPDHELLVEIEKSLRRPVPRALEPALLLAQEMNRAVERKP